MTERIRQMSVRHHDLHVAEQRRYADTAESLSCASDFACVSTLVIRDHFALGEAYEVVDEVIGLIARHVNSVVWNRFGWPVIGWCEVPIQLHLHATGPLDDRIHADRVLEWFDDDLSSGRTSGLDRLVHVRYQIPSTFLSKRERDRRFERKHRQRADRSPYILKFRTARHRQNICHEWLGRMPAER